MVQWLKLHVPNAGGRGLIPGRGSGSPHATRVTTTKNHSINSFHFYSYKTWSCPKMKSCVTSLPQSALPGDCLSWAVFTGDYIYGTDCTRWGHNQENQTIRSDQKCWGGRNGGKELGTKGRGERQRLFLPFLPLLLW